jgi:hypothetical protein
MHVFVVCLFLLILAGEKFFVARHSKSQVQKTIYTLVGGEGGSFYPPSLVNFLLCTHLLKLSRIFTPPPLAKS